jgi:hypothetical protein
MAARFEQKNSFNKLNYKPTQLRNYKLNSQTKLKLRVGVVPGVCHPRLRLHPVLINLVLVRTQTPRPLYIASGIGRSNTSLTLLDPLAQPPQGEEVHTHNGGGHDGGIMQDLIMESLHYPSPTRAHSFVIGPATINNNVHVCRWALY